MWKRMVVALAMSWCLVPAASAEVVVQGKITGKVPEGSFSFYDPAIGYAYGFFFAVALPDGSDALFVLWEGYSESDVADFSASGLAPLSAVTVRGNTMKVDFDSATLKDSFLWGVPGKWTGSLEIYSGPGSQSYQSSGETTDTHRAVPCPVYGELQLCTSAMHTTGTFFRFKAQFEGTVGPRAVQKPAQGYNADWSVHTGQASWSVTTD